jgi:hypothetical protein
MPTFIFIAVYALAFFLRFEWLIHVQHPLDAVYSDAGGYVDRADWLLAHHTPADPRILAIYPWGGHALLALQFLVVGRKARVGLAVAAAVVGAIPAPCLAYLSLRIMPSRLVAACVGVLVAAWVPQIAFAGFFLSEIWFSAAIAAHAALTVVPWKRPWGRLGTGAVAAIAFVVRPQFVLTWAADVAAAAFSALRRGGIPRAAWTTVGLALPMILAVGFSAARLHRLAGHWGLISENDEMTRIWAETDICELRSTWTAPNGQRWSYWFSPPSKPVRKPSDVVEFEGFIADPAILRRIRQERLRGVPWTARIARKAHNVALLYKTLPWPESNYKDRDWRFDLQRGYATALLYVVSPLALVGIFLGRRDRALFIAAANLCTSVLCAALFFGEGRYHVPYDPFALLLAVVACYEIHKRVRAARRRQLDAASTTKNATEHAANDHPAKQAAIAARAQPR